ncbi:hypothetical protein Syun_003308 [Stephania yunnanensis]|uniref:Pectin acetylesterase n=1 Tax=Stephania yunnanensis TaxID=152371 RepID=A0AAP0L169_9MAGN
MGVKPPQSKHAKKSQNSLAAGVYTTRLLSSMCKLLSRAVVYIDEVDKITNKSVALSVGDRFFDRVGVSAIDCPYPCDNTCHNLTLTSGRSIIRVATSGRKVLKFPRALNWRPLIKDGCNKCLISLI